MSTPAASADGWRRLDGRVVLITALLGAGLTIGSFLPLALILVVRKPEAVPFLPLWFVLPLLGGAAAGYVKWRRTRYRLGPERAELRSGLLLVKRRSLPRERIRSVDLTAHLLLRVLGLVKVRIGTGEQTGGGESTLELDPVTRAEGERLRRELLGRQPEADTEPVPDGELAVLDPAWVRYAPVSFLALVLGGVAVGGVRQVSDWFGVQDEVVHRIGDLYGQTPLLWVVVSLAVAVLLAGAVGAVALWVEKWWNYRLEREPGGTLRVRRGLFTARSVSIEERRLRGVELVEPLGVRLLRAARVDAVATGLVQESDDRQDTHKTLLPAAPRAVAQSVAAAVLRDRSGSFLSAPLTPHPRAARARRLRWALAAASAPVLALLVLAAALDARALWYGAVGAALLLPPAAVALALDAYRSLGHGLGGGHLLARSGTVRRSTVALQRGGVVGWTLKQSYAQRRAGLLTLTATTAAGDGAYDIRDADQHAALRFAAEAVPGLLEPFLEDLGRGADTPR
ncbi:PH domain-containing protein [Streptomyces sp. MUM 203J]|uniref:PH domain-containing protein n=1 Tax=Streptomyces sp. MUM 203J TaxID=2791990 RepID=UPI001F03E454|nr:PH domain-containing protein [Streptomyces sp. MUM 203J]MCH0539634.1 PH domain-containing protein [Streptomyces sp. MUM 203J]